MLECKYLLKNTIYLKNLTNHNLHLYLLTIQYIPILDPKKGFYFHIGRVGTCALNDAILVSDFKI